MFVSITSGSSCGIHSCLTQVEVDTSQALPGFDMVGCLGSEVREARERVRVALRNTGIRLPAMRITVNISPAGIRKDGTAYDLPIAVGILVSIGMIPAAETEQVLFLGELGLNGELKGVSGVLPVVSEAAKNGITTCIVPKENEDEAAIAGKVTVLGFENMKEILRYLTVPHSERKNLISPCHVDIKALIRKQQQEESRDEDFAELIGQESVRRSVEIAAAGFHNLLMIGPPGAGKTMAARRIPSILPPMSLEESMEVSKVYSILGKLNKNHYLITKRPFLNPHHSISEQAMIGGGRSPKPGTISLAHKGVLFLDEFPEFKREVIEALRQPLEEKQVHIARSMGNYSYPADVMLVAAMNPCPCGFYPDREKCRCTPNEVRRYRSRISGPILDRMDMIVETPGLGIGELTEDRKGESSREIRKRIILARKHQQTRYKKTAWEFNSQLDAAGVRAYCRIGEQEQRFLTKIYDNLAFSVRGYHRLLKLARTIADLDDSEDIRVEHISEAICYRMNDMWNV